MERIVVIGKKEKIGEVYGQDIINWCLLDVVAESDFDEWCRDRGYETPILSEYRTPMDFGRLEVTLWNVDKRA